MALFNSLRKEKKGQLAGAMEVIMAIIAITLGLVVVNVMFSQIDSVNTNSLGANANASASIDTGFSQLATSQSIITLVIVVALLGIALGSFLGVFRRGG